jgi:SAM-dependent methyltransferase
MNEKDYDVLLGVKTEGNQAGFGRFLHYHRYEPTPYSDLAVLFNDYSLKSTDRVVDFGCGKGRLNFYVHYLFNVSVVGIEMNEGFYTDAVENRKNYIKKHPSSKDKIHFHCCLAEEYVIDKLDNRFYFFNPFTIQIFMNVINNILFSVEQYEREVELILYYSSDEYIYFLENQTSFELKEEIILHGKYEYNPNERFLVYRLRY